MDNIKLTIVVGNLAVGEQIGELYVHCRFGIKQDGDCLIVDPSGCPQTVRLNSKKYDFFILTKKFTQERQVSSEL